MSKFGKDLIASMTEVLDHATNTTETIIVDVYDGKYTVIIRSDGTSTALRYGEEWPAYKDETQLDNLTVALAIELNDCRLKLKEENKD